MDEQPRDHAAIDLAGMLAKVPREALEDTVRYHADLDAWCVLNTSIVLPAELAVLIQEASMARWFAKSGYGTLKMWHCGRHWHVNSDEASDCPARALASCLSSLPTKENVRD